MLNVFAEGLPLVLLHLLEIILLSRPGRRALEVGDELDTQIFPQVDRVRWEIHQRRPGRASQGYGEVVAHDLRSSTSGLHHSGVDLEELVRVVRAIVLLDGCGPKLLRPVHASEVVRKRTAPDAMASGAWGSL